jgi:hypothetical protein
VVVIAGETGSGKTTQLPKLCLTTVPGMIRAYCCTQRGAPDAAHAELRILTLMLKIRSARIQDPCALAYIRAVVPGNEQANALSTDDADGRG